MPAATSRWPRQHHRPPHRSSSPASTPTASRRTARPPDVIEDILKGDCGYDGKEFYLGGEIVKRGLPDDKTEVAGRQGRYAGTRPAQAARGRVPTRRWGADHAVPVRPGALRRLPHLHGRLVSADGHFPHAVGRLRPGPQRRRIETRLREEDEITTVRFRPVSHGRAFRQCASPLGALAADGREPYPPRPDRLSAAPQLPGGRKGKSR